MRCSSARALLQRLALGQQRALVDHDTQKLRQGRPPVLRGLDACDVQVAGDALVVVDRKDDLLDLAVPQVFGLRKGITHAPCVL